MEATYTLQRMDGKHVLVIGGLGFIGSNISQRCVSLGARVTIYDACLDPYGWNFANIKEIRDQITFIKGDTRDVAALQLALAGQDIIYDCAAQVSHLISVKDPQLDIDITLRGGMNVLEIVRQFNKNAILIYAGTRGAVGKMVHKPITEEHPTHPMDINGINKLAVEKYYLLYHRMHGMNTCVVRINNTYGERADMKHGDYGIVNFFLRKAMRNEQISINGEGLQTRDYNYVQDVVDALLLVAQKQEAIGEMFFLGSNQETRFIDMCNTILSVVGSSMIIEKKQWDASRKAIEIGDFVVNPAKIHRDLGWWPKTSLQEGLKQTHAFYKGREAEYF